MNRTPKWPRANRFRNLGGYVEARQSSDFKPLEERVNTVNEQKPLSVYASKKLASATIGTEVNEYRKKLMNRKRGFWRWCLMHGISVQEAQRRWRVMWREDKLS